MTLKEDVVPHPQDDLSHLPHHCVQHFWPCDETAADIPTQAGEPQSSAGLWVPLRALQKLTEWSELNQFISTLQTVFPPLCTTIGRWQFSSIPNMLSAKSELRGSCLICVNCGAWTIQKRVRKGYYTPVPNCQLNCNTNLWRVIAILLPPDCKKELVLIELGRVLVLYYTEPLRENFSPKEDR